MCWILHRTSAHEMLLTSSDDVISEYTGAFQQLKERFLLRSSVATLKVCREVRQGVVQLSDTVEYIKDMGSLLFQINTIDRNDIHHA